MTSATATAELEGVAAFESLLGAAQAARDAGDYAVRLERSEEAVALGRSLGAPSLARALLSLIGSLVLVGRADDACRVADEALALAAEHDLGDLLHGQLSGEAACACVRSQRWGEALAHYRKAIPLLEAAGDDFALSMALLGLSALLGELDSPASSDYAARAYALIRKVPRAAPGTPPRDICATNYARTLRRFGRLAEAAALLEREIDLGQGIERFSSAYLLSELAHVRNDLGRFEGLEDLLDAAERQIAGGEEHFIQFELKHIRSASRRRCGDLDAALALANSALEESRQTGIREMEVEAHLGLAEVHVARGEVHDAERNRVAALELKLEGARELADRRVAVLETEIEAERSRLARVVLEETQARLEKEVAVRTRELAAEVRLRERAEQEARFLADHDSLTGLPNRGWLLANLRPLLDGWQSAAILFVDLDRFKPINDSFGHAVGDVVLREVAQRLRALTPNGGAIARIGGDEFVVVVPFADRTRVDRLIASMLERVAAPLPPHVGAPAVSASIGIALAPRDGSDAADLIRHADLAMYAAKRGRGAGFAFYGERLASEAESRRRLERDLRAAVRRGELTLHYQPQVGLADGHIADIEALLRWPARPEVSIDRAVRTVEEIGAGGDLAGLVMRAAWGQAARWRSTGDFGGRVWVNVATSDLSDDLVGVVSSILEEVDLPPHCAGLEIIESLLLDEPSAARRAVDALGRLGVAVAIDDFGSGYSNLRAMERLPIAAVKFDREFIVDLPGNPRAERVLGHLVGLARDLGMRTVAEGVERADQDEAVRQVGCDVGQGFHYTPPRAPGEMQAWLRARAHARAALSA